MNPLPSKNPANATRGEPAFDFKMDFDVNFAGAEYYEFSELLDQGLVELEARFASFVTNRSQKRSFGR
jgi:hypothetical protein